MKKITTLLFIAACMIRPKANAQLPFPTIDSVNINNISASVLVHGDMWWNPATGTSLCFFPPGIEASINFASALWMSGYDAGNNLHLSAQTYRQNGNSYWPGPLDADDTLTYRNSYYWDKIWKLNRTDIYDFLALPTHTIANTPPAILTWPAKGNVYATGNAGYPLVVNTDMAPFVDLNGNGIYEPLAGEYPDIKGDQALWWVFSDNGPSHAVGKPLGVEVHAMSYAYKRNTLIDNVVYYEYNVINKSTNTYHDFRLAQWDDVDLGWYLDNYIGFDSTWRMGICYQSIEDNGGAGSYPAFHGKPPVVGLTMVSLPGDVAGTSYVPAGNFTYYNDDFSIVGNPVTDTECNYYMRGRLRDGEHFTNDFTGRGHASICYGSGPDCNYVYTGDPGDTSQWSECNCGDPLGERRFVLSSNDFTLSPGGMQKIVIALVTTDTAEGSCPHVNFTNIRIVADTAWKDYYNPPAPLPAGVGHLLPATGLSVYPNPANNTLCIEYSGKIAGEESIAIYNAIGQLVRVPLHKFGQKWEADISGLPGGLYNVLYRNGNAQASSKFVKEE